MQNKPKILFVYDHKYPELWKDGLWAALKLLEKDFDVSRLNLYSGDQSTVGYDFVLGWGGFGSSVDIRLQTVANKKGLCLGGYAYPQFGIDYDVLFYETEWSKLWLEETMSLDPKTHLVHAFGVNTSIYRPDWPEYPESPIIWDYLTVGAFAKWKRQTKLLDKPGNKFAIGEIQENNLSESMDIIGDLMLGGVGISNMVEPEILAKIYRASTYVYIPADIMGGGERAVLEARACSVPVEVEPDNPKLQELLTSPIWNHHYYAAQLKKGIEACL